MIADCLSVYYCRGTKDNDTALVDESRNEKDTHMQP